jgi:ferritin-like protein
MSETQERKTTENLSKEQIYKLNYILLTIETLDEIEGAKIILRSAEREIEELINNFGSNALNAHSFVKHQQLIVKRSLKNLQEDLPRKLEKLNHLSIRLEQFVASNNLMDK